VIVGWGTGKPIPELIIFPHIECVKNFPVENYRNPSKWVRLGLMGQKQRLDKELVLRGLAGSRGRSKELIKEGAVMVGGRIITDPALSVGPDDAISLSRPDIPWVSRSALKLEHALKHFSVSVKGKHVVDIGASTGGFTEVLLASGADHVYALDVGHAQLHEKLRADERVTNMEGVHVNDMSPKEFPTKIDLVTIDVSFISLTKVLEKAMALLPKGGHIVALLKPQFEVGKEAINKGLVKDEKLRQRVIAEVSLYARSIGLTVSNAEPSPIHGSDGNKEFLLLLTK
jgi:23S rRNA (cytidine1920-2'-O)/16S rRNA (cytidine1409-2'-O)-methyltransferase